MSDHTVLRAAEAPDVMGGAPGSFFPYARTLGSEQLALNVRVLPPGTSHVPPGAEPGWGHSHATIEEIYVVLDGEVRVKAGDEVETLGPRDAILLPPATPRLVRNDGAADAVLLLVSVRVEDQRGESVGHDDFWPV